ncbi:hypothetical protein CsSME_00014966 [Camellia sinensis var. sinensis]
MWSYANKDLRKYFAPHWSVEAVNEALEKGHVFKALFRVNAHNRLQAYCKIDGVQLDVLISGIAAHNRAVSLGLSFAGDFLNEVLLNAFRLLPYTAFHRFKGIQVNLLPLICLFSFSTTILWH